MKSIAMAMAASAISLRETVDPVHPTGLEPPPTDPYYDDAYQRRAPLIWENWRDSNDWKKDYTPSTRSSMGNYVQIDATIDPVHPTGLEPEPKDPYYGAVYQRRAPLIWENWRDSNDWKKDYTPSTRSSMGNY